LFYVGLTNLGSTHLPSERGGTGQTGPLRRRRAVEGKRADEAGLGASCSRRVFDGEEHRAAEEEDRFSDTLKEPRRQNQSQRGRKGEYGGRGDEEESNQRVTSDLGGVDGVLVVGVRQQMDVEAERHVADRGDLVLRRASSVQEPGGGELQLLQSVEAQPLHEGAFNLRARREETGKEGGEMKERLASKFKSELDFFGQKEK